MSSFSNQRKTAFRIFHHALAAIDVETVTSNYLRLRGDRLAFGEEELNLPDYKCVIVIAIGKASMAMTRAVDSVLGERVTDGLVVTNAVMGRSPERLPVLIGGHPLPNPVSLEAAARALKILRENDAANTLVLFLISGGGSAMFELPVDPRLTLEDLQAVNRALVGCGALINEMNIVRRNLSAVKGGKLACAAPHSRQISLYVSDVNSDDLRTVASGLTLPDQSTLQDFYRILERYDLLNRFPATVRNVIETGKFGEGTDGRPSSHSHHILLDNRRALAEARWIAESEFGLPVEIADDLVEGDVEEMALTHLARSRDLRSRHAGKSVCLLSGGEVICPVRGDGRGGRNQEFVLRAAMMLEKQKETGIVVLSAGTDGIDGNSPADGAIADGETIRRACELSLSPEEHLVDSDSFTFFDALGDAIITGPTGNNVRDLRILIAG